MGEPNDNQMALVAKAQAAGPPATDITSINKKNIIKQSWQDAAKEVQLKPRDWPYPNLHNFEKSILPSISTLNTQFSCEVCPHCSHPIISSILHSVHLEECSRRKQQQIKQSHVKKEEILNGSEIKNERPDKTDDASVGSLAAAPVKRKRKQHKEDADIDGQSKKTRTNTTKSKEPKKTAKTRQPKKEKLAKEKPTVTYNPDRNCGVPLPNGHPCMRSLTCKQHPMGAKRAVAGRSAPYDVLLSNYHRQHQMKQAQLTASAAQAAQIESDQQQELEAQQNPEREISQVFEGVSFAVCAPLAVNETLRSTHMRTNRFRMREMLSMALLPRRLPPTGNLLYGRSLGFKEDDPDQLYNMRSQAVQQAVYIRQRMQLKQRQQQMLEQMKRAEASKLN